MWFSFDNLVSHNVCLFLPQACCIVVWTCPCICSKCYVSLCFIYGFIQPPPSQFDMKSYYHGGSGTKWESCTTVTKTPCALDILLLGCLRPQVVNSAPLSRYFLAGIDPWGPGDQLDITCPALKLGGLWKPSKKCKLYKVLFSVSTNKSQYRLESVPIKVSTNKSQYRWESVPVKVSTNKSQYRWESVPVKVSTNENQYQ